MAKSNLIWDFLAKKNCDKKVTQLSCYSFLMSANTKPFLRLILKTRDINKDLYEQKVAFYIQIIHQIYIDFNE